MASPATSRQEARPTRQRSTKKRSTSSSISSFFASLTSFSPSKGENTTLTRESGPPPVAPTPPTRTAKASSRSRGRRKELDMSKRKSVKTGTATAKNAGVKAASKAQLLPKSVPAPSYPTPLRTVDNGRPNVFSFITGEVSTPPTPRPQRNTSTARASHGDRLIKTSFESAHISSPTPRRPVLMPHLSYDIDSSDSDDFDSPTNQPSPVTPTTQTAQILAAKRSLQRLKGQDAVGRSIRIEDYYQKAKKKKITPPPEPRAGTRFVSQKQSPKLGSPTSPMSPFPPIQLTSPGAFPQYGEMAVPYPTPPLESQFPNGLTQAHGAPLISKTKHSQVVLSKETVETVDDSELHGTSSLPRQYRILTQSTIKRTEAMIDNLETQLRTMSATTPHWEREQLLMRLSNTLVMHHRLVDIWSKISQLHRLNMSKIEDRQKIEAVWSQLRQQYSHMSQVNGLGVDKFISNIVNDLVHIGERAQMASLQDERSEAKDLRVVLALLGLIVFFLLLRDETFQKFTIAAGVAVGIYMMTQNSKLMT